MAYGPSAGPTGPGPQGNLFSRCELHKFVRFAVFCVFLCYDVAEQAVGAESSLCALFVPENAENSF